MKLYDDEIHVLSVPSFHVRQQRDAAHKDVIDAEAFEVVEEDDNTGTDVFDAHADHHFGGGEGGILKISHAGVWLFSSSG